MRVAVVMSHVDTPDGLRYEHERVDSSACSSHCSYLSGMDSDTMRVCFSSAMRHIYVHHIAGSVMNEDHQ